MTAVLQPTIPSPFNTTPGPPSCRLDGPFSFSEHAPELDTVSINTVIQERSRPASPMSIFSVVSAPIRRNDENVSPVFRREPEKLQLRSASAKGPQSPPNDSVKQNRKIRNFTFQPLLSEPTSQSRAEGIKVLAPVETQDSIGEKAGCSESVADQRVERIRTDPSTPTAFDKQSHEYIQEKSISKVKPVNHSHNAMRTPETGVLTRIRELRGQSSSKEQDSSDLSPTPGQGLLHQQRLSDGSSGFVHSMRTASVTDANFSIFPRSSRVGRSRDSYMLHGSQSRYSMDSDRPWSSCSVDDIALKRGFKRKQIINELISTEETYVSDLKALVYLYSTLLASTSSIPNRLRSAIEQNVVNILRSHETLVEKLHGVRLQAAARRWADTAVPARLVHYRKSHLRHSEKASSSRPPTAHRHTRSDDSADVPNQLPQRSGSAEPIDVHEITAVFKGAIKDFSAYEEYCANFESIGHELQKHLPQLWPTFESGMESLARAVVAIDQRQENDRRGLTVGDLLIKPIQRLTKYPLMLEQLLHCTPVADAPSTHAELDLVLQAIRDVLQMVNLARDSHYTRLQIQRRWLLQDRLDLSRLGITAEQFRCLGQVELCGVLHVAYQTTVDVAGGYALCALMDEHFLVAFPMNGPGRFEAMALIQLSDIKLERATDGKGLQCSSNFFTWKISFACAGYYNELILSGCSKIEEDHWTAGLRGEFSHPVHHSLDTGMNVATCVAMDLKSAGVVFSSQKSLSREPSVQRSATVGGRPSISQVIVRNTYNAQDLNEYRDSTSSVNYIGRSQSHMNTKRVPVLEPKRSERTRLENSISDIWTKERLPFPGMVGSRGGQIIRASAGTLARKLSLASIHTPFSKGRTSSLSMASRKSYDLFNDAKSTFEIRRKDPVPVPARMKPKDIPEVDDMRSVVGRMIGAGAPFASDDHDLTVHRSRSKRSRKYSFKDVGPGDPAAVFYEGSAQGLAVNGPLTATNAAEVDTISVLGAGGPQRRKRRWSKPMSKFRELKSEAMSMLYSSSSGA